METSRKAKYTYYGMFLFLGIGVVLLCDFPPRWFVGVLCLMVSYELLQSKEFDMYTLGEEEANKLWK